MGCHGTLRIFRSALLTGVVLAMASAGHKLGGGDLPAPGVVAALTALLLLPVTVLAGRQLSYPRLLVILGAGQVMFHQTFSALSPVAPCQGSLTVELSHHSTGLYCLPAGPVPALHSGFDPGSLAMLAGHALATMTTALVLHSGESSLWRLLAWLHPLVQILRPVLVFPSVQRLIAPHRGTIPAPWRNLGPDCLRGPPSVTCPPASIE